MSNKRPQSSASGDDRAGEAQRRHYPVSPHGAAQRMSWHSRRLRVPGPGSCTTFLLALALFAFGPASTDAATAEPANSPTGSAIAKAACPSQDFASFLQAFSESSAVQRRYTRFPLEFGLVDLDRDAGDYYQKSVIHSFEKIPNYDPESDTVYPTPAYFKENGLVTEIFTTRNSKSVKDKNVFPEEIVRDPASIVVLVHLPDSGVIVFYRFRRQNGCWFLHAISDRST